MSTKTKITNNIKNVIGIMSGKGGVGKSLITSMLAVTLNRKGYKIGVMDADITGPSIPKIFGIKNMGGVGSDGIVPVLTKSGIKIISINMFLEDETRPVIWRGPLIGNVIKQFWDETYWGDLDYLFIDLPPGTSDAPLTVMQSIPLKGMIIVSTPQELVSMIVEKAINMTEIVKIPIIGLIENMSYLNCPDCNKKIEIFGKSNGAKIANEKNIKFLGSLPIYPEITSLCDEGKIEEYKIELFEKITNMLIAESKYCEYKNNMKKIALPTEGNMVSGHFGHCEKFILIDVAEGKIINKDEIPAPEHQPGFLPGFLAQKGVNVIIAGGMGVRAKDLFTENNIEVFAGVNGSIDDVVNNYINGTLKTTDSFCSGHGDGHTCGH